MISNPAKVSKRFLLRRFAKKVYHKKLWLYFRFVMRAVILGVGEASSVYIDYGATTLFDTSLFYILMSIGGSNILINTSRQLDFNQYAKANALLPKFNK